MSEPLLEARHLTKEYPLKHGRVVHALTDVSISVAAGETCALVGESGCGKSTLARQLICLESPTSGEVRFRGEVISNLSERAFQRYRRELQLVFQDPYASLNPRMCVRDIIAEPLVTYKVCATKEETTERVMTLMDDVGVPRDYLRRYPHQFSGGQRQRIGIARAIALDPALVVLDEPVSALDVSVQNQILNLLRRIQEERSCAFLFISHDLTVVRHISKRVVVMFLGHVVEVGTTEEVFAEPLHPYTSFLLGSVPQLDPRKRSRETALLRGEPPSPIDLPKGCCFCDQCPHATSVCRERAPELTGAGSHQVACHLQTQG